MASGPQKALEEATARLSELISSGDESDPEIAYQITALQCKRYMALVLLHAGDWMEEDKYQRTLQEWVKRRSAMEGHRKNRLLPLILEKLEKFQGTGDALSQQANAAQFFEDDE